MKNTICSVRQCINPLWARGLCNMHLKRLRKTGTTDDVWHPALSWSDKDGIKNWLLYYKPKDDSACWEWTRRKVGGYGATQVDKRCTRISHLSVFAFQNRRCPTGKIVLHSCDNPLCWNPAHLSIGTFADNSIDMVKKGHAALAKLTHEQVLLFRERFMQGENPKVLAAEVGMDARYIARLCAGKSNSWNWLPTSPCV